MILYAVIMLAVAALFGVLAYQIYKGRTELIHDYHQTRVKDKAAYGKSFGKAFFLMAVALGFSGLLAFFTHVAIALAVLFLGLALGIAAIIRVQKKYNGGVF